MARFEDSSKHKRPADKNSSRAIRVQGVIAEVQFANPHAYIFIEDVDANRTRVRWAVDNSGTLALTRQRFDEQRDRVLTGRLLVLKSVPAEHWWHYGPLEAFQALLERHR